MEISNAPKQAPAPVAIKLKPIEATSVTFSEFGQVVEASQDGDVFGPKDAQLDLSHGIPRFRNLFSFSLLGFLIQVPNINMTIFFFRVSYRTGFIL